MEDDAIRALVARLARPHPSGGKVIERAAILAEGADFAAVMAWVTAHGGIAEATVSAVPNRGLHSSRLDTEAGDRTPLRFVLPAGALEAQTTSPAPEELDEGELPATGETVRTRE